MKTRLLSGVLWICGETIVPERLAGFQLSFNFTERNIVYGVNYISGTIYLVQRQGEITAEMVYGIYGNSLKILDVLYGVILIGYAAFGVVIRFRLSKYKENAPNLLIVFYILGTVMGTIYNLIVNTIVGTILINSYMVGSIILGIIIAIANYKYFKRRTYLFVN